MFMKINNEGIYSVLKYSYNNEDVWIYSTIIDNDNDSSHKYYLLYINDNYPKIIDVINPIDTLKQFKTKPTNIKNNPYEYMKFLAMKNLAESNIKELKMSNK